jgi:hypothetical protein
MQGINEKAIHANKQRIASYKKQRKSPNPDAFLEISPCRFYKENGPHSSAALSSFLFSLASS